MVLLCCSVEFLFKVKNRYIFLKLKGTDHCAQYVVELMLVLLCGGSTVRAASNINSSDAYKLYVKARER